MALSDLLTRLRGDEAGAGAPVQPTMALAPFLTGLGGCRQPVLLDLGPVVESNLSFFGSELGCKVLVEDLLEDVDRHARPASVDDLAASFDARLSYASETIDGILCWDVFDYLERSAAERLAFQLTRLLRPSGLLLAFFGTVDPRSVIRPTYIRHVVVDRAHLEWRPFEAARAKQRPLFNRDIQRLFEGLEVTEHFLLETNLREVLFRKPGNPAAAPIAELPVDA